MASKDLPKRGSVKRASGGKAEGSNAGANAAGAKARPVAAVRPKSTGPKTVAGKSRSALNAVSHGLTSARVLPDEVQMVEAFTRELSDYYQPHSPLEVLQIQRIAFCRAKLARLIDIEWAGRHLARSEIERKPELVMARLDQYPLRLRNLARLFLAGESPLEPLGLDAARFEQINREIDAYPGMFSSPQDLGEKLPALVSHLTGAYAAGRKKAREKLSPGANFSRPSGGSEIESLLRSFSNSAESIANRLTADPEARGTFEELLKSVRTPEELTPSNASAAPPSAIQYDALIRQYLRPIAYLAEDTARVPVVIQSYEQTREWMLRSADLTLEDADRMMKYQSMLERRLSTAIGELIELQKHRRPQSTAAPKATS